MTIKIRMLINGEAITMLFGDSYKKWTLQFKEFLREKRFFKNTVIVTDVLTARTEWIGFGGLKWCSEDVFQECLDKENRGRKVSDFQFEADRKIGRKVEICFYEVMK